MKNYRSVFSSDIEKFIRKRKLAENWNDNYDTNLRIFDNFCADHYPGEFLNQEMINEWCGKRKTEDNGSCHSRIAAVIQFVRFMIDQGYDLQEPYNPKPRKHNYIPHFFTEDELTKFFDACDSIVLYDRSLTKKIRKIQIPVLFRLLYSTGIRTTEARLLKRCDVDLVNGVLNIQKSKGYDQHYVALHESMTEILIMYDETINKLQPDRTYFFENASGKHYEKTFVSKNFAKMWKAAGLTGNAIPYEFRHNYVIENIMSWDDDCFLTFDKLLFLQKSLGHRNVSSTLYYFSLAPTMADKLYEKSNDNFNEIVPEVWDYAEEE